MINALGVVRYLHPADHHPAKIRNVDQDFTREHDFKDIKLCVKNGDIHKMEKRELELYRH